MASCDFLCRCQQGALASDSPSSPYTAKADQCYARCWGSTFLIYLTKQRSAVDEVWVASKRDVRRRRRRCLGPF